MATYRLILALALVVLGCAAALGEPGRAGAGGTPPGRDGGAAAGVASSSVPAARAADRVVVVPIHGPIDRTTAAFVRRRLDAAVREGANAVVFEIDSPGGELNATLRVCSLIKASKVPNTVAWVNTQAYSGGAIVALACREIVAAPAADFGDALPVQFTPWGEVRPLADAEREKFIGPLLAEAVDSARRSGFDELLVQGFVRRGVELWLIEHETTGQRIFVNEVQYRVAVGGEPDRTATPTAPSVTGGRGTPMEPVVPDAPTPPVGPNPQDGSAFIPAAPGMSPQLVQEITDTLSVIKSPSRRPSLASPEHAGRYRVVEYVSDGYGVLTFKTPELVRFGLATEVVSDEAELKAFFGATQLRRLPKTPTERFVGFMTNPMVRGALIVLFLVCMFLELTSPGLTFPGIIAACALAGLLVPPALIDMASWWEIIAVLAGIVLIAAEVFVLPGFGICGVAGIILLFVGLIGTFVQPQSGVFPSSPQAMREVTWGVLTVIVAFTVAGVAGFFLWRSLPQLPMFKGLVLDERASTDGDSSDEGGLLAAMASQAQPVNVGDEGVAVSPLRPIGRARFGDAIVEVQADSRGTGFVQAGDRVRVVRIEGRVIGVDRV